MTYGRALFRISNGISLSAYVKVTAEGEEEEVTVVVVTAWQKRKQTLISCRPRWLR